MNEWRLVALTALDAFTDDELTRLMEQLTIHALWKMKLKPSWRGSYMRGLNKSSMTVRGLGPEDVAYHAIEYLIENPDRCLDPKGVEQYLCNVIDSRLSTLVECKENRVTRDSCKSSTDPDPATYQQNRQKHHEDVFDDEEHYELFKEKILRALSKEPLLQQLFECLEAESQ